MNPLINAKYAFFARCVKQLIQFNFRRRICGSALPNLQMEGRLLVVPAGSLDSDLSIKPNAHLFVSRKANWDKDLEMIPMIDKLPT
jgi:hypothetical protein